MHTHTHTHIFAHILYSHSHTHTHKHTHTHTHTHTYSHTLPLTLQACKKAIGTTLGSGQPDEVLLVLDGTTGMISYEQYITAP